MFDKTEWVAWTHASGVAALRPRSSGRRVASAVYFSVPIVAGYFIMQWAEDRAKENLGFLENAPQV